MLHNRNQPNDKDQEEFIKIANDWEWYFENTAGKKPNEEDRQQEIEYKRYELYLLFNNHGEKEKSVLLDAKTKHDETTQGDKSKKIAKQIPEQITHEKQDESVRFIGCTIF